MRDFTNIRITYLTGCYCFNKLRGVESNPMKIYKQMKTGRIETLGDKLHEEIKNFLLKTWTGRAICIFVVVMALCGWVIRLSDLWPL